MRGLLIGRFQPFHAGHLAVAREIRRARPDDELLLGVGSAQESYTWRNPFTSGERLEMICRAIREAKLDGVVAHPIPDLNRFAIWVRHVESILPPFDRVYTNNPLTRLLFQEARYVVESPGLVSRSQFEGEIVRKRLAVGGEWASLVPPSVAQYLNTLGAPARLAALDEIRDRGGKDPRRRISTARIENQVVE